MNDALPIILLIVYIASGVACVAFLTAVVLDKVSANPHSAWTLVFVTSAGLSLMPIANTLMVIVIVIALALKRPRAD